MKAVSNIADHHSLLNWLIRALCIIPNCTTAIIKSLFRPEDTTMQPDKKMVCFSILCVFILNSQASCQTFDQLLKKGRETLANEPGLALAYFYKAMETDSNSIDANFYLAEALRLTHQPVRASYYYQKVYKKAPGKIYPESIYYLALTLKSAGNYKESANSWKKVQKIFKDKKSEYYQRAEQEIKICRWAEFEIRKETTLKAKILKTNQKFEHSHFAAILKDSVLYFSSLESDSVNTNFSALWKANLSSYRIDAEQKLGSDINMFTSHQAALSFSHDGKRMYFTRCESAQPAKGCKILVQWQNPDGSMNDPDILGVINETGNNTHAFPAIINNEEYLIFSSDREGGYGGYDIWYSTIIDENNYSKPVNAGKLINTPGNEISPAWYSSDTSLYFSSDYHPGLGGYDIIKSKGVPGGFKAPENIGIPWNSPANDLYFKKYELLDIFTRNLTEGGESCCNRIWYVKYPKIPLVTDSITPLENLMNYLPVVLYFHNDRPDPNSFDTVTSLSYGESWESYHAMIDEYKTEYSKGLKDTDATEARMNMDSLFSNRIDKGWYNLQRFTELMAAELEKGRNIEVTVQGFASPLAETKYNVALTKRRISSLVNHLMRYKSGALEPYLTNAASNGGSLDFVFIPFGEYSADQQISDNPNDKQNSVYSIRAALERKIEIQKVKLVSKKDDTVGEIKFQREIFDLGSVKPGEILSTKFSFSNQGNDTLKITGIEPVTSDTDAETDIYELSPGQKGTIIMEIDTSEKEGHQVFKVKVHTNGVPGFRELMITCEIK